MGLLGDGREIAFGLEDLRQRRDILVNAHQFIEMGALPGEFLVRLVQSGAGDISPEPVRVGSHAGEERGPARRAGGGGGVGTQEKHPLTGEFVDVGGLNAGCAEHGEVRPQVIAED